MNSMKKPTARNKSDKAGATAAPRKKRIYLPAEERRRMIIEAAQEAFAENTLGGVSTRRLAKAAQVNIATLFQHFGSKDELFRSAVVEPLLKVMRDVYDNQVIEEAIESDQLESEILPLIENNLQIMIDVFPLLAAALFSDGKLGKKLYREQIFPLIKLRSERLKKIFGENVDTEFLCIAGLGIEFAVAMDRVFRNRKDDLHGEAVNLRDLMFDSDRIEKAQQKKSAKPGKSKKR